VSDIGPTVELKILATSSYASLHKTRSLSGYFSNRVRIESLCYAVKSLIKIEGIYTEILRL